MGVIQIVSCMIFLALATGAFVISYFQFKKKGYLFNNAYFWTSQEERKRMDENKESKGPHYRQSGFTFMFIGLIFLTYAFYIAADWIWMLAASWAFVVIAVAYAIVSSVQIERLERQK